MENNLLGEWDQIPSFAKYCLGTQLSRDHFLENCAEGKCAGCSYNTESKIFEDCSTIAPTNKSIIH